MSATTLPPIPTRTPRPAVVRLRRLETVVLSLISTTALAKWGSAATLTAMVATVEAVDAIARVQAATHRLTAGDAAIIGAWTLGPAMLAGMARHMGLEQRSLSGFAADAGSSATAGALCGALLAIGAPSMVEPVVLLVVGLVAGRIAPVLWPIVDARATIIARKWGGKHTGGDE